MAILKIDATPKVVSVQRNKVVSGKFGSQLWLAGIDVSTGEDAVVYLPWTTAKGEWSAVTGQLIRTQLIGPEDLHNELDQPIRGIDGHTFRMSRVFKDGAQYINVDLESVTEAAVRELGLDPNPVATVQPSRPVNAPTPMSKVVSSAPRESADARIKRAFDHVMAEYAPVLAEMDPELVRALVALTATHAIAYEHEGR